MLSLVAILLQLCLNNFPVSGTHPSQTEEHPGTVMPRLKYQDNARKIISEEGGGVFLKIMTCSHSANKKKLSKPFAFIMKEKKC